MIGILVMFGGILATVWTIILLDWLARRRERRHSAR